MNVLTPSLSPFGAATQRYWDKRRDLFSLWDHGVQTDEEGLFSVKPEKFALETADILPGRRILDAFCGIGGSAIAFARRGKRVVATDVEPRRLSMARHNARVYGVDQRIDFLHADVFTVLERLEFDALNLDPPWGGPSYNSKAEFLWEDFAPDPTPLIEFALARRIPFALGLPMNFSQKAIADLPGDVRIIVAQDDARSYFKTVYYRAQ
jgi:trimethylguanosine synthase